MALFGPKRQVHLEVSGMTCGNCQRHVEEALRGLPGVTAATVDLAGHRAAVTYDPRKTDVGAMVAAVGKAGYEAKEAPS